MYKNKRFYAILIIVSILLNFALPTRATEVVPTCRYCDFANMFVGEDKFENFNRKVFNLNTKLNKYLARPVHILWSSIIPKCGMDRLQCVYNNIEYPKRLVSCLVQKDFDSVKSETKRFIANSTLGLGGMFDVADKVFKIKPVSENMDQALCNCKVKSGHYIVMPILSSGCPRSMLGRILEAMLDPSAYLAYPLTAIIKFGLVVNKTSYMQPLAKMIESNYADPYEITKKLYGMENYIKSYNLDRKNLLNTDIKLVGRNLEQGEIVANTDNKEVLEMLNEQFYKNQQWENETGMAVDIEKPLVADIVMMNYNPQNPVVDSMRTAFFDVPNIGKSFWNELSCWNRSFIKRIKTDSVNIVSDKDDYKFRYILQKDKNAPLAIIYPSIGEGINSHHSSCFAKLLYDEGYSVLIQGSHFQWEFVRSMPSDFRPGMPSVDSDYLKLVTSKIIDKLERENNCKFSEKILMGTSFGGMMTLFIADKEYKNNTLGINKFIALSPPIELVYALKKADKNSEDLENIFPDMKERTAVAAAKVIQLINLKESKEFNKNGLPFTENEGKLIVSFLMRQKLSDLVFAIENINKSQKTDFYDNINNLTFENYVERYILAEFGGSIEEIRYDTSLYSISDYLKNNDNYKIFESIDDFFVDKEQIQTIKNYSPNKLICLNNGSHLGYLYRKEFLDAFKKEIQLN